MRITKIKAQDFMRFEALEQTVPSGGLVASGGSRKGKTTVLRLVQQAILAQGISPSSVRLGADCAKLEVTLDDSVIVRRRIAADGTSTVAVKTTDGMTRSKPQQWLDAIASNALDPIALISASKKERRAMILAALPVTAPRDVLLKFMPEIPAGVSLDGHGFEVLARLGKHFYDMRAVANANEKTARAEAERLAKLAPLGAPLPEAPSVADAERELRDATAEEMRLQAQHSAARKAVERTAATRAKIAELRRAGDELDADRNELRLCEDEERSSRERIAKLEAELTAARNRLAVLQNDGRAARGAIEKAEAALSQADALEAALAESSAESVSQSSVDAVESRVRAAVESLDRAKRVDAMRSAERESRAAGEAHQRAVIEATRLDKIVRALADDAPKALPGADAIPGLAVDGDDVTLDGKRLDALAGSEQIQLAVRIAKRARGACELKLLVVDKLEGLDAESFAAFAAEVTGDGWQCIGSRVTGGDLTFEAIEPDNDTEWT